MFGRVLIPVFAALLLLLAACGDDAADPDSHAGGVASADVWVKATDGDMTAVFAVLSNSGDEDAEVVAVTTDLTEVAELHETADGTMRPVESFVIPAGDSLLLQPGGDHLMLMDLTEPIEPGQTVDLTLEFADGSTYGLEATAKDFAGGDEDYEHEDH